MVNRFLRRYRWVALAFIVGFAVQITAFVLVVETGRAIYSWGLVFGIVVYALLGVYGASQEKKGKKEKEGK